MEGLGGGLSRLSAPVMDEEWGSEEAGADLLQQWEVGVG